MYFRLRIAVLQERRGGAPSRTPRRIALRGYCLNHHFSMFQ